MRFEPGQKLIDFIRHKNKKVITIFGQNNQIINGSEVVESISGFNFNINGDNNEIIVDTKFQLFCNISIKGNNNKVHIHNKVYGILDAIEISANNCNVEIGENTGFSGTEIKLWEDNSRIIFKNNSIIAKDTKFYCSDFHSVIDFESKKPINQGKEIIVGEHCWLCEGVKVLKNAHIASDTIVGIGAIVTKDLNDTHSVYAGIPAKHVKSAVSWDVSKFDDKLNQISNRQEVKL